MDSKLNNLLIVEDNSFIKKEIFNATKEFSSIGEIKLSETLQKAIFYITNTKFEIIILDLKLPDGNGIELLKFLKEKHIKAKVFIFSMSTELKSICLKCGAFAFFDKANDFDKLLESIK